MKHRLVWASALALAVIATSQTESKAAYTNSDGILITNGVIVISTRTASDALYRRISSSSLYDADDFKGPGVAVPGDSAMAALLSDHGYVTRLVPEWLLRTAVIDPSGVYNQDYLGPWIIYNGGGGPTQQAASQSNVLYSASLVIISGSGSGADMPEVNTNGIPVIMGEHSCLGETTAGPLYMYGNKTSGNQVDVAVGDRQYMKVIAPNHPIMQGIPLDAQGRVKIWRDPYPEEELHKPAVASPKLNYRYSWTWVDITTSIVAPGTIVIGLEGDATNRAVFAVNPAGAELYNGNTNHNNFVHLFVNEHGSGDARRAFNCLTDIGRVIFVRTCKWAMGEALTPYQPLGLIRVSKVGNQQIRLSWDGIAAKNYKILGTRNLFGPPDFSNWQTVVQDIPGSNGTVSATLDISGGPQYAFLRVMPVP
jgi:hypothetical protein